jgi:hypothetical protein
MIYPVVPEDKLVIIAIRSQRCIVSRYLQIAPYTFDVQSAVNWEALERDARQAAEAQIGALVEDDDLPCPDELAARAVWPRYNER